MTGMGTRQVAVGGVGLFWLQYTAFVCSAGLLYKLCIFESIYKLPLSKHVNWLLVK